MEKALAYFKALSLWCQRTKDYLSRNFRFEENARPDGIGGVFEKRPVNSLNASAIFCPVTPLIENRKALLLTDGEDGDTSVILSQDDFDSFLKEHRRTLDAQLSKVKDTFPASDTARLITQAEASTMIIVMQIQALIDGYCNAVGYVEHMLYTQLEQAVGKKITSKDFNAYMLYHNKRLFLDDYVPKPFCYSIRRPDHFPEGLVTLEQSDPDASGGFAALPTITSRENNADNTAKMACMSFALNAATTVRFSGPRYVHAAILQQFTSVASLPTVRLCARARQFSSFILMLGTLAPGNEFEPKHALIIKDKDDLQVWMQISFEPLDRFFKRFRTFRMIDFSTCCVARYLSCWRQFQLQLNSVTQLSLYRRNSSVSQKLIEECNLQGPFLLW